jgi:hypothetical protein
MYICNLKLTKQTSIVLELKINSKDITHRSKGKRLSNLTFR